MKEVEKRWGGDLEWVSGWQLVSRMVPDVLSSVIFPLKGCSFVLRIEALS